MDYERLVQRISALPPIYREVLCAHFVLEQFSMPEVARCLGIKMNSQT